MSWASHEADMKLLLMADHHVGLEITRWLIETFHDDLAYVVTTEENDIFAMVNDAGIPCLVYQSADHVFDRLNRSQNLFDLGILAWWPKLLRQPLLGITKKGFINTHPSFLPYNRGKHYNFWALVEQVPFGVSLHYVDESVDSGDVVAQNRIPYGWEDNGATLYTKACQGMVTLFKAAYPEIRQGAITPKKQDLNQGSFHLSKELEPASVIHLDKEYRARDLLNLIRARTFPGHPACCFSEDGIEYEVRVDIKRRTT